MAGSVLEVFTIGCVKVTGVLRCEIDVGNRVISHSCVYTGPSEIFYKEKEIGNVPAGSSERCRTFDPASADTVIDEIYR